MTNHERELIRIGKEFAEACADCEELRTTKGADKEWSAAWDKRQKLLSVMMNVAKKLTTRETEPKS